MSAYYNEFDPKAAAWLRELIKMGMISDGEVDERSITEVAEDDLKGFTQHHFFAGIGVWSYALGNAGWSDDRPVWTASLPCQPFSTAGKQKGTSDERHLLPHFLELVRQCKPDTIFGEQVEGAIRHGWLDDLQTNMEREGYAVGHCVLGAHSVNAAHIRQRLYWVADSGESRYKEQSSIGGISRQADNGNQGENITRSSGMVQSNSDGCKQGCKASTSTRHRDTPNPTSGIDWLYCRDNKYRPIKSGIEPLVDGVADRVVRGGNYGESLDADNCGEAIAMRLKGYGNAIVAPVAEAFISAFMEAL